MRVDAMRSVVVVLGLAAMAVVAPSSGTAAENPPAPAASPSPDAKGAKETQVKYVAFDHLKTDGDRSYVLKLSDGEPFQVRITSTCPEVFSYEVHGIVREEDQEPGLDAKAGKALETKVLPVIHDEKYGGYIVTIQKVDTVPSTSPCFPLLSRTLMISTPKMTWDLSFSGGFTLTTLNNPHYYLRPHPTEAGKKQVQEDATKEDDVNLGIATYVHLYHHRLPWLAGTFGLGIRDQSKTEYYLGAGYRFSDKATVNAGLVFGPVTRLKDGVNVNDAITDDNVLNDPPTRTRRGFFVGISYSFIDVRGKLQQPFAGATGAGGASGTGATPKPKNPTNAPTCTAAIEPTTVTLSPAKEATATVKLTASPPGCEWKITDGVPSWATVEPASGKGDATLTIKTKEANTLGQDRPASTVDISGAELKITQSK
jgi:hypothetical protein